LDLKLQYICFVKTEIIFPKHVKYPKNPEDQNLIEDQILTLLELVVLHASEVN